MTIDNREEQSNRKALPNMRVCLDLNIITPEYLMIRKVGG